MALSVDYLYQFMLTVMKKAQAGGLTSTEFAKHWNNGQSTYMNDLLGPFQARNRADPQNPRVGLLQNQTILGKLAPFVTETSIAVSSGLAAKPDDFIFALNLSVGDDDMWPVALNQINNAKKSVIDPPEDSDEGTYYYAENDDNFKTLPATIASGVILQYIKSPTDVFWAYTFDGDGRQVYDAANSVQPVWDDLSCREITMRAFKTLGVSFKDGDFFNFGNQVQAASQ